MSDYQPRAAFIVEQAFDANSTTQKHPLGMIVRAEDTASTDYGMGEFIYLKGVASTALGDFVTYSTDDWSTARLVTSAIGPVAIAMAATVADEFGWYQISGKAVGTAETSLSDDDNCYSTGTAGSVDENQTGGDRVQRCKAASDDGTPSSGLAEFEIHRPEVNDALSD